MSEAPDKATLEVANLGPIAKAAIELRPLTVFVGPSNTGKSYLAILMYALHRFFDGRMWTPPLYNDFLDDQPLPLQRDVDAVLSAAQDLTVRRDAIALPESIRDALANALGQSGDVLGSEIERCFGVNDVQRLVRRDGDGGTQIALHKHLADGTATKHLLKVGLSERGTRIAIAPPSSLGVRDFGKFSPKHLAPPSQERFRLAVWVERCMFRALPPVSQPIHYLPADRTGTMHAHRVVVGSLIRQAARGGLRRDDPLPVLSGVLADFLEQLVLLNERLDPKGVAALASALEREILEGAVLFRRSELGYPSFHYRPRGWDGDLPLMNTSSMVSELAPLVLYLRHIVKNGDVLIIEEPESHLHPAVQVAFTRWLARAVRSGIRVVVTTHSEWILEALANLVRLSEVPKRDRAPFREADIALAPDDVGIWAFARKAKPAGTVVEETRLDTESGTFGDAFSEVTEALYNDWARICGRVNEGERRGADALTAALR